MEGKKQLSCLFEQRSSRYSHSYHSSSRRHRRQDRESEKPSKKQQSVGKVKIYDIEALIGVSKQLAQQYMWVCSVLKHSLLQIDIHSPFFSFFLSFFCFLIVFLSLFVSEDMGTRHCHILATVQTGVQKAGFWADLKLEIQVFECFERIKTQNKQFRQKNNWSCKLHLQSMFWLLLLIGGLMFFCTYAQFLQVVLVAPDQDLLALGPSLFLSFSQFESGECVATLSRLTFLGMRVKRSIFDFHEKKK